MSAVIFEILRGFAGLFWPNVCLCCSTGLVRGEKYVCGHCMYDLPTTGFHRYHDNPVAQAFWGRVPVEYATAVYFFRKGNNIQKLVHQVKYHDQMKLGIMLGREMGKVLIDSSFNEVDVVVPVPLHRRKYRRRGYNQSECIARGVAEILGKPLDTHTLIRRIHTASQTRKKRLDRWKNVETAFGLATPDAFAGRHVLLIDDVVTTGATLEACMQVILTAPETKVSVATLAVTSI